MERMEKDAGRQKKWIQRYRKVNLLVVCLLNNSWTCLQEKRRVKSLPQYRPPGPLRGTQNESNVTIGLLQKHKHKPPLFSFNFNVRHLNFVTFWEGEFIPGRGWHFWPKKCLFRVFLQFSWLILCHYDVIYLNMHYFVRQLARQKSFTAVLILMPKTFMCFPTSKFSEL